MGVTETPFSALSPKEPPVPQFRRVGERGWIAYQDVGNDYSPFISSRKIDLS